MFNKRPKSLIILSLITFFSLSSIIYLLILSSLACFCVFDLFSFFPLPYTVCLDVFVLKRLIILSWACFCVFDLFSFFSLSLIQSLFRCICLKKTDNAIFEATYTFSYMLRKVNQTQVFLISLIFFISFSPSIDTIISLKNSPFISLLMFTSQGNIRKIRKHQENLKTSCNYCLVLCPPTETKILSELAKLS